MGEINLKWFFELPGLFITGGVLLIIIALIVFVIGSKKSKKKTIEENQNGGATNQTNGTMIPVGNVDSSVGVQPITPLGQEERKIENDNRTLTSAISAIEPTPVSNVVEPQINPIEVGPIVAPMPETVVTPEPSVMPIVEPTPVSNVVEPQINPIEVGPVVTPMSETGIPPLTKDVEDI